jgi:hypothetical protein
MFRIFVLLKGKQQSSLTLRGVVIWSNHTDKKHNTIWSDPITNLLIIH